MSCLISIIVATYNSANTLRTCLDSVCAQKFQDWECIVVDGASKDSTLDIVNEFRARDSRIRYISEPDSGIYDAFNKGWRMAKGEWIHYLGSDDMLTEESFAQLIPVMTDELGAISGDVWIKKIDGTVKANLSEGFAGCHQGKIVRRSVLKQMNGFDQRYRILADHDLMIRMKKNGIQIVNVRSFVSFFEMDGASQNIRGEWDRYKERVQIYKENGISRFPEFSCGVTHLKIVMSILYRYIKKTL